MVFVLNNTCEVISEVTWQRAITLVTIPIAEVYEAEPEQFVRSQHLTLPLPRSILLHRYVYIEHDTLMSGDAVSYRGILQRDGYRCAYCDRKASTVDHVFPSSRGGQTTWTNCVAACAKHNGEKGDRTPEEAGMPLLWDPRVPKGMQKIVASNARWEQEQQRVYDSMLSA